MAVPTETTEQNQASAPSGEAPAAPSQEPEISADSGEEFDFAGLESALDENPPDDVTETPAKTEGLPGEGAQQAAAPTEPSAVPPVEPPKPEGQQVPPAAQQQASQVPQQQNAPNPQEPPAGSPQQQQPAEGQAEDGFTALDRAIEASRTQVIDAVAKSSYQLTQEELEGVQTEPEKFLPQLMARVHVNAVQGVLRHVASQMPALVNGIVQARSVHDQLENEFYSKWPKLDRAKHGQDIVKVAQVFRQVNPKATREEFIRSVGAQVMLMYNLHQQAVAPQVQQPQAVPPPFQPAGVGHGGAPQAPQEKSVWEELVEYEG